LEVVEEKDIAIEKKDITDSAVADELIEAGGKRQVPYLVDSERGVSMYESDDIITYLVSRISGDATVQESTEPTETMSGNDGGEG
jgi:glutathione S-transferase